MIDVQLVRLDPAIEVSLTNDPAYLSAIVDNNWAQVAYLVHRLVGRTLTTVPLSVDTLEWGGYFVVDIDTREVVGSCAFKGQPTEDGAVEIAYLTYPDFEGKGYATSMARKLISLASHCPTVKRVVAHTLPEVNASTRVLEKVTMTFVGEVIDPDDGRVWQWQTQIRA
jgi:[ribosomal protein S5]-alanine N-acetyltransferase